MIINIEYINVLLNEENNYEIETICLEIRVNIHCIFPNLLIRFEGHSYTSSI